MSERDATKLAPRAQIDPCPECRSVVTTLRADTRAPCSWAEPCGHYVAVTVRDNGVDGSRAYRLGRADWFLAGSLAPLDVRDP